MMMIQENPSPSPARRFLTPEPRPPADVAVAQSACRATTPHHLVHRIADLLKRLFAFLPATRLACRPAWELTGITRIDRYDIAPWLFF
jgi:hypothetical protein